MSGLRLAAVLAVGLVACALPAPHPQRAANAAEVPDLLPAAAVRSLAPLASFGEGRLRHAAPVYSLAFTRDGKTLATTTRTEPVVWFWDSATGRLARRVRVGDKAGPLTLVGFSADGRGVLVVRHPWYSTRPSEEEREWGVADAASGEFRPLGRLAKEIEPPSVSPDGTMIGGIDDRNQLTIWSFDPKTPPRVLGETERGTHHGPDRVAFSPGGKQVVACTGWWTLYLASTDGRGPVRQLRSETSSYYSAVYWPRADRIITVHDQTATALDPTTGRTLARSNWGGHMRGAQVVPGGLLVCKAQSGGEVFALDPQTLAPVPGRAFPTDPGPFAATPDGKLLALAHGSGVRLLDAATGAVLFRDPAAGPSDPAERIDFSADGRRMIATGGGSVQVWDLPNGRPLASAAVPPSEDYSGPPRIALSTDGRWAITSSPYDVRVVVRDAVTGRVAGAGAKGENRMLAGFDGPGRVWSRNHSTGDLVSYPLPDGPAGRTVTPPAKYGFPLSSPDGRWLASSGSHQSLSVLDTLADAGWVQLESYRNEPMPACGRVPPGCAVPLRFSPDGRFLVTWWRGFCLWQLGERTPRLTRLTKVRDQDWWYPDAVFSHDGRRLAAVVREKDKTGHVRVWETASGAEAFRFDPPGGATGCGLTPDGKRLVIAHPDTTFSVWDFPAIESGRVRNAGHSWDRLGSREASVGLGAVHALVADPDAVAHLKAWFAPTDAATVAKLVADLDANDFATREAASKGIAALGEHAEAALREAVSKSPSAEVRRRAGRLLDAITGPGSVARLRAGRAAEALERIGTPEAQELLSYWAKEYRGTALAAEAATALARLVPR